MRLFHRGPNKKTMANTSPFYKIEKKPEPVEEKPVKLDEKKPEPVVGAAKKEPEKPVVKIEKPRPNYGKVVVYTCVTGGYDELRVPVKTDGVDYVCFTDNTGMTANGWSLRPIPEGLEGLTNVKKQRMVKVLPHRYLPDYDMSIWVDGSVEVKANVIDFLSGILEDGRSIYIPEHPARKCIYSECDVVKKIKKDTTDLPDKQMKKYRGEGFPKDYGLVQSNIMARRHNDKECIRVMEAWAAEIREFSHRDQLSFNYALWKTNASCFKYLDKKTCNSKYFFWNPRHGKIKASKKK